MVRKESVPEPEEKATGPAQLETLATTVRKHHHATQMRKVWDAMMKDSELTANLHYMVETGKFARSAAAGAEGMLPQSCNKFSMMRADRKEALLRQLLGKKLPGPEVLKHIRKKQKNFFDALLCSLLNIEITCAVFTKDLAELTRICKDRAKDVKSPMLKVASMSSGIDWQAHGVYQWVKNERGAIVKLKHVQSTAEVDLSDFGHQVDDTWKFDRNWDTWKCRLVKGKVAMLAFKLFEKHVYKSGNFKPLRLSRVPPKGKVLEAISGDGDEDVPLSQDGAAGDYQGGDGAESEEMAPPAGDGSAVQKP